MSLSLKKDALSLRIAPPWQLRLQDGNLLASVPGKQILVPAKRREVMVVLQSLVESGSTITQMEAMLQQEGNAVLEEFRTCINHLKQHLILSWEWRIQERVIGVIAPLSSNFRLEGKKTAPGTRYIFSRFALLRREENAWILESPLLLCRFQVIDPALLVLFHFFSRPQTVEEAQTKLPELADMAEPSMAFLLGLGFLEPCLGDKEEESAEKKALKYWEFHDLYFHSRTRLGRHNNPFGSAQRFGPPPTFKPYNQQRTIFLPVPNTKKLKEKEITLFEAMELRQSQKKHGQPAINLIEIGEFLFRAARIKGLFPKEEYVVSKQPYPSAGGSNEIEWYLLVGSCSGLPEGFYRYEPIEHALIQIQLKSKDTDALYASVNYKHQPDFSPQIIIILSSRFARNSWKYQSIGYANTLKHVGVLFQNMYLVATAMGLAANAWSTGNSDLFNQVSGTSFYEESSVGEFLLGAPG